MEIFPRLRGAIRAQGATPAGPRFARYYNGDPAAFDTEAGIPFTGSFMLTGDEIRVTKLPAGRAAKTLHIGPYYTLSQEYRRIEKWLAEEGHRPAEGPWESYLDDELERDGQRIPRPVRKTLSLAPPLVLTVEELTCELVLFRSRANEARRRGRGLRSDAQPNPRCLSQVTDPVGAGPSAGEHVHAPVVETEPDLDRVLLAGAAPGRREIGEIFVREAFEHLLT
jgi:effector-binding domain-containing protein